MPWKFWLSASGAATADAGGAALSSRRGSTWLILPVGLALSGAAFHFAADISEREATYRFESATNEVRHRVEIELRAYSQVVYGLQALFSARPGVTSEEFERYVSTLNLASRYPAFSALTFARYVPRDQRKDFERAVRESGRLAPSFAQKYRIRAPEGLPYHFAIDYVYPDVVPHSPTIGIDISADPERRPAMEHQVETGELASSGIPITQVSRALDTNVLPMRVATYRPGMPLKTAEDRWRAVTGSVGAAFHVRVLFDHALQLASPKLRLRVYDVGRASDPGTRSSAQGVLIYDSRIADGFLAEQQLMTRDATFEQRLHVDWATRRWVLQFTADESFVSQVDDGLPWVVLAGGLVTTLLIFAWLQALARSREHAVAAQRAQSTFLANMSHELRTPLNAILGYAQILGTARNLDDRQSAGVRTIRTSGDHLLALIDDILDLARVEAGRLELYATDVDLLHFLNGVAEIVRVRAEQKGLVFELRLVGNLPQVVRVDEKRLRQVLLNLLGNAVKFTDAGRVELRVKRLDTVSLKRGEVALLFEIEDTGVGMERQQVAKLFQPFQQVGDVERRRGGTGLGLAISRQLVRLMGSEIRVTSTPGEGSVFWFELKLPIGTTASSEAAPTQVPSHYAGPRRTVLVVDDSAENREVLTDALKPLGFEVFHATNGAEGLERASNLRPDVILMDNVMPVMDGLEATRHLRALSTFERTPIIAISASASKEDIQRALDAGATAFMPKPFRLEVLISLIEEHLGVKFDYE